MTGERDSLTDRDEALENRRPFDVPLLFVGVRCIARYLVLPFVLPLLGVVMGATRGVATGVALGILLVLDLFALLSIVATLRWLWRQRHPRCWHYLPIALALAALVALFFMNDVRVLNA